MEKINFVLLDHFKKLKWAKQKTILLTGAGVVVLVLLIIILSFCSGSGGSEPEPEHVPEEQEIEEVIDVYFVTAHENSNINVRKEPTRSSDRILSIKAGDTSVRLKYLGESRFVEDFFWHHVELPDGSAGWVREDVVVEAEPEPESDDEV